MKIAIIGTGKIVNEAIEAMKEVPRIEVKAIFARPKSEAKGRELAARYDIDKVYTDYAKLLKESGVDFVYIGNVNSAHYDYTKEALNAGVNVISEKPFTSTAAEAAELAALVRDKKLYLFEAITNLHLPNFQVIKENLPRLGAIKMIQANYSQYSSRYDQYKQGVVCPAFSPELSGGCLYDLNIYNLNLIVGLFGRPDMVRYTANIGFNGIDTSGVALLRYNGYSATAVAAKDSASPSFLQIQGDKGYIRAVGATNELQKIEIGINGEEIETVNKNRYSNRMVHEFKDFLEIFENQEYGKMAAGLTTSMLVMDTAEKARRSAGIIFPADSERGM